MTYIHVNPYKSSCLAAKQELEQRKAEVVFATQRITYLEQTIRVLEPLANEDGVAPNAGLPELCRQILMSQPTAGFTAGQIMQCLANMGVDINGYSNPLAVLHTTLTRIAKAGSGFYKRVGADKQPLYAYNESLRWGLPPPPRSAYPDMPPTREDLGIGNDILPLPNLETTRIRKK